MSNKGNIPHSLSKIRGILPSLSTSEARVGSWILSFPEKVIHLSMAELAQECSVSDTSVLRFCRNAGFQGYTDLKIALAMDLATPIQMVHDSIRESDDEATMTRKVFLSNIQAIQDMLEMIDMPALIRAVDLLESANWIYFLEWGHRAQ